MERTEIIVLLDRSGSMEVAASDHSGGLNSFVDDQRGLEGEVCFTFIRFDSHQPMEIVYDGVPLDQVGKCELVPRGGTPLLDALGQTIGHVQQRLEGFTGPVVFMVITDGIENSSRYYTRTAVKELVKAKEQAGWKFLFLGANVDAFTEARNLGIATGGVSGFSNDQVGTKSVYGQTSGKLKKARTAMAAGASAGNPDWAETAELLNYTADERLANQGLKPAPAPEEDTPTP